LLHTPALCFGPQALAEDLLRAEGFSTVEYVEENTSASGLVMLAAGRADVTMWDAPGFIPALDAGEAITVIGGIHAGCWELFARGEVKNLRDLRGKIIAVYALGAGGHILMSSMLAYVGMDPSKDVRFAVGGERADDAVHLFVDGRADAFIGFPPHPQELRAKRVGHLILDTKQDRPWSQYFCCMLGVHRPFAEKYPIATKRALRAFLKGADLCAQQPERVARYLVEKGWHPRYEVALEVVKEVPYRRWREASPEDTLRFHALRLHEVGMIKSAPQKLIAKGTDWRFLNELKIELKA
jgi:NitT/TauT family transport system substrate-binding protein